MKRLLAIVSLALSTAANAASQQAIVDAFTQTIVYLEVTDDKGNFMDGGSGFIVSHDGYVVTVEHVKPASGQKLWAVIGQRLDILCPSEMPMKRPMWRYGNSLRRPYAGRR
jgi:S1-C subfamily serine protease